MIGIIKQTASGSKLQFEIQCNNELKYKATQPALNIITPIEIENKRALKLLDLNDNLIFHTGYKVIENEIEEAIAFKYLATGSQRFNKYEVFQEQTHLGSFYHVKNEVIQNLKFHIIYKNVLIEALEIAIGTSNIIIITLNGKQIAQITKPLAVAGNLDEYYLHLLDAYKECFEILSFFAIYYDYYKYRNAGEYVYGKPKSYKVSYSLKKPDYDKDFIAKNFGQEESDNLAKYIAQLYGFWTPKRIIYTVFGSIIGGFLIVGTILAISLS